MDFSELKKAVQKQVAINEPDFLKDNPDSLNIGYMELNPTQKIIFSLSTFKGKKYFSVRNWFQAESGDWAPTKKGINLSFRQIRRIRGDGQAFCPGRPAG